MTEKIETNPEVTEMVREYLRSHGYDGLVNDDGCGCDLDDLGPCYDGVQHGCEAAYKKLYPNGKCETDEWSECGGDCPWHMVPGKPKATPPQTESST